MNFEEAESDDGDNSNSIQEDLPNFCEQGVQTNIEDWDQKIVDAIINALPLKHQQGDFIKSFEDWLKWAKDFVIIDQKMKDIWPTSWAETEDILKKVGYESPKH